MSKKEVFVGDAEFTFDHAGKPSVWSDHGVHHATTEELLELSEWVAQAYEVLEGAPYVHAEYDKGLVAIAKEGAPLPDPSFLHLMSDPGPRDESYGREQILERDCE